MTIVFAILATLWWLAIWGIFELYTKEYSDDEKLRTYITILGVVCITIAFFPKVLTHL